MGLPHAAQATQEGSKRNIEYHYDAGTRLLVVGLTTLYWPGSTLIGEPMDVGKALGSIAEDDFEAREAHLKPQYAKIDAMIDRLASRDKGGFEIACWGCWPSLCRFPGAR